ncbi:MAG: hypothetical protein H6624_04330 [Bdellovibrionaceae bacterium]|nr:hypothetical protein [Bdellovibrionales bacterium]MCB9083543.1 hypothetical protein [Pseudobdellovibrionaceae bacterium]
MSIGDLHGDDSSLSRSPEVRRGGWLTAFLILMFIANPLTAISYFLFPGAIVSALPKATEGLIMGLGVMAVLNTVFAAGIWMWKKWGVYGFYASAVVALIVNVYIGLSVFQSLLGLLGPVIVYLLTKGRWQRFE